MSGLSPVLEHIKYGTNKAENTKSAIIFMAEADATIKRKIKEIEEKAKKEIENGKTENIHLDINEVERIVLQDER